MIKIHNPTYYENILKPRLIDTQINFLSIDLKDDFTIYDINKKSKNYLSKETFIKDLSKTMQYITNTRKVFIVKQFDAKSDRCNFVYKADAGI
jgi:hypothetical protein